ncbi:MAG: hypothetical protein NC898_03670 [Candidatus Omnitrophica bacterium]|nr:hypothetical protein [Candidatus Omnitrophota bacterium]MCM8793549.1 hypothetical protein [Candidatus Omnitrophota bacterium]
MSTRLKGRKKYVYKKYVYKMIITIIMFCLVLSINFVPSIKKKTDLKINYSLRRIHSFKILDLYPLPSGEGIWKTHDGKFEIVIKDGIVTFEHRAWERIEGGAGRAFAIYYSIQLRADNNGIEIKEIRSPTLAQAGFSDPKPEEIYHLVAPGQHLRGFVYTNDRKYNTQRPSLLIENIIHF